MEELKNSGGTIQFIVIKVGEEQYGIDIKYVDNIIHVSSITRVPKVASYVKGVINVRGEVIPVMDIRTKMGLPEAAHTKDTRIVIIKSEQHGYVGLIVDAVREVVTLEIDTIEKMSYDRTGKDMFVTGVGKHMGALISLLDLNEVLAG
ncbi:MAG: chemotaxis protein CheW [Lachnospiraceae bacterium]|nr:chemotaxis protein CheW [Lachnospiraceae bacterium]